MGNIFIGTSGYIYKDWEKGVFYPNGLPQKQRLSFYAEQFCTVELNSPFYHLPKKETFEKWRKEVPESFIFSVKVSRFITHIKRLKDAKEPWDLFLQRAKKLQKKLGPFLLQFPAFWKKDLERLHEFLKIIQKKDRNYRYAFEFRHKSWFDDEILEIFRKQKKLQITLVLADSKRWPTSEEPCGPFVYIRMHGGNILYGTKYTKNELRKLAKTIKKYNSQDVYVYFNNDTRGYAVENARTLENILANL